MLFLQLKAEIPDLKAISIRDRDDQELNQVDRITLADKTVGNTESDLLLRVWRRRHIENYLMHPAAISRACGAPIDVVEQVMAENGLSIPSNFTSRDVTDVISLAPGKQIIQEGANSVKKVFGINPIDIANVMAPEEISDDIITFIDQTIAICASKAV